MYVIHNYVIHPHVCMYVRTYVRTYTHTCIHTYIHIYIHTYIHTYIHIHTHTHCTCMQSTAMSSDEVTELSVYTCTGQPLPTDIAKIVEWMLNEDFSTAYQSKG